MCSHVATLHTSERLEQWYSMPTDILVPPQSAIQGLLLIVPNPGRMTRLSWHGWPGYICDCISDIINYWGYCCSLNFLLAEYDFYISRFLHFTAVFISSVWQCVVLGVMVHPMFVAFLVIFVLQVFIYIMASISTWWSEMPPVHLTAIPRGFEAEVFTGSMPFLWPNQDRQSLSQWNDNV